MRLDPFLLATVRSVAVATGLGTAAACGAQTLYRCGSTFSQTPCAADAAARALPSGAPPDAAPGLSGYALCAAAVRQRLGGPEPETAVTEPAGPRRSEVIQHAGAPLATHRYDVALRAKNRYGMVVASGPFACWVSEDQRRVLQLAAAPR